MTGDGQMTAGEVAAAFRAGSELALVDVRPEGRFAEGHPLFAASLPLDRLEVEVLDRIPRRDTPVVVYGDGRDDAGEAVRCLAALGYRRVSLLAGGLAAWAAPGRELFRDVNSPSKAFGELVADAAGTPLMDPERLHELIRSGRDVIVLDARRPDEYSTMSIPTAVSVPGAELVLRVGGAAPDPDTTVVVNCAGRTRSIIGAQSLRNAGLPNPVFALENGTIGWALAGLALDRGRTPKPLPVAPEALRAARTAARTVATAAGVRQLHGEGADLADGGRRTVYRFDVRSPEEYEAGHPPGFRSAPGGQLVQETDVYAPVRGARIVLFDDDGVRAAMTGSWLAQMG